MKKLMSLLLLVGVLGLGVSACGGGDSAPAGSPAATPSPATSP